MIGSLSFNIGTTGANGSKMVNLGAFLGRRQIELGKIGQLFHSCPGSCNSGGCGEPQLGSPMMTMQSNF